MKEINLVKEINPMGQKIILDLQNITVGYKGKNVIDNLNLQIVKGKIVAVVGPNGCGKTTLLRTAGRSLKPESGRVLLDGQDIFQMKTKEVAQKMAVLSQANETMSDVTVTNLVRYGRFAHKQWWQGASREDTRIVDWAIAKTGLSTLARRKINTLSGGERQRAWIAMALAQKPEILLLDEPSTYLDIAHQLEILELIAGLSREEGLTILMVLHDINHAVRFADQLVVLQNRGGVALQGDPWEVHPQ